MPTHIVLLGGGYGGLRTVQRLLSSNLPNDVHLTLIDRMPYHCLKTEYYALAAGTEPDVQLRVPFPQDERLEFINAEVLNIDLNEKQVELKGRDNVSYDYLIIGLGCEDKYHGIEGAEEHTYSIQTMERVRETYHKLSNIPAQGTVSIVGGGLSGVEVAAELRESRADINIQIYDRNKTILAPFPKRVQTFVENWFRDNNVEIIHEANITKVEPNVLYNHDEPEETDAIVWTAGIQANFLVQNLPLEKDHMGRVVLTEHHHLPDHPQVFVVGDCASLPHAPSAQLAEAQGEQIAEVLQAMLTNAPLPQLPEIKLKGVLGSLGKKSGFGLMGETKLTGRVPRMLKSGVLWMYKRHSG
jgi:NADH:ubiquinone reductase (H+-translocating)